MEILINSVNLVIPCPECQAHATTYINANRLPSLKGLQGELLRSTIRTWLFHFHNFVRLFKGQPILLNSPEECTSTYAGCFIPKCEYQLFVQNVAYAVRQNWVRLDNWKKWYSASEKLRILIGNIVV